VREAFVSELSIGLSLKARGLPIRSDLAIERFSAKWIRFAVENCGTG
jgi:hypothetical protein